MDPIVTGALVGMSAQVLSGIVGELIAAGDREKAFRLLKQAYAETDIPLPDLEKITAETLGPSAFDAIRMDPTLREAQMSTLDRLSQIDAEGGLLLADEANLNRLTGKATRAAAAQNAAVRNDMQARGVGGSGAELAMQLSNNQAQAERGSQAATDIAAQAQQRALEAIMARGNMAGDVRAQDYGEAARAAEAKDMIARYNAASRERANYHNADLGQQQFNNRMRRGQNRANAATNMAQYHSGEASRKAQMVGGAGNAVAYGSYGVGQHASKKPTAPPLPDPDEWENPYGGQ